jgi:glycosyltransferase involved in cell wall biosynthesis
VAIVRLVNGLARAGAECLVMTAHPRRFEDFGECIAAGVPLVAVGNGARPGQLLRLIYAILAWRVGVLVAQDTRAIDLGLAAKRVLGDRFCLVCAVHNLSVVRPESDPRRERRKARRFAAMARLADGVIAVSPGVGALVRDRADFSGTPVAVIPNPAQEIAQTSQAEANRVARPRRNAAHVISVGRLEREKDQTTLLRAFADLLGDGGIDADLTVLGEGKERGELQRLAQELGISDRVHMPGFVRHPMAYMADADVFALSSTHEAFGYVLVEALSVALPVVSTDCPTGPAFILQDGAYGRLVPVGDPRALARGMAAALADPGSSRARRERAQVFAPLAVARQYIRFLAQVSA